MIIITTNCSGILNCSGGPNPTAIVGKKQSSFMFNTAIIINSNKKAVLSQGYRAIKFDDNIHYKFKSSQASKARLQSSIRTSAKQNLTQNGHSRSRVLESVERR